MRSPLAHTVDALSAFHASLLRHGRGLYARGHRRAPAKLLELYDLEGCSYCRKVREALTELDLDALILPCPKGGRRYRPRVRELGGKTQFPFLVDPNTGTAMYESNDIVRYLYATYGHGKPPLGMQLNVTSHLATGARLRRGLRAAPSRPPEEPLVLYGFEASPYCRLVREWLTEHEVAYEQRNVGKGNPRELVPVALRDRVGGVAPGTAKRQAFVARSGKMQVPYLVDPSTGSELFESEVILDYLAHHYGA